ncbi:MAG: hypothetical protein UX85_C0003G0090 [Candidatus Beckwithbacteria bacterium GW2011_GWB1_47_15]|uniref:S-adenosyl-l-methionine hydroxide adenosyltransferase n=1 Tax=Candidatus Beckwithbacteria bacterium GW2011_GWB1_47_15 TaxID=1618371 RepID=A0A0G1RWC8_9BACT|nr:MAG: hypothetical protein UY43_C0001G0373 [Candidatus Beckwithbacteria bacterium GW2011_GWC1_49_16]KKU35336.1 MAG: hypothetical protein UX50_C0004G0067 [Candidatus Beckwithbacteria bacterium GW2011_GWA1_46_30]KKU61431.1 MAG: hypothetical protein UX85_C0003G0090 [Candidatus Beckwithbacteria bacterium GW2011_GWB1_47_15]KKU71838.1 MAG: hypothetical protein UX97_C0003G0067 [Candidatus Beckwithbacteria bacterium GW2011_GWA2_47_25]KKW03732.1 MAG: hypothetical protein UY37_C0004G0025 [Candidatus Be
MAAKVPFIHIVADYGTGDLAFAEVIQRFKQLLPQAEVFATSTPPFSTLNTGFCLAQLTLYNPSQNLFIYSNTAPRKDNPQKRLQNEGEKFVYLKLENGVEICAVNAGYCLSFIKSHIKKLQLVNVKHSGSQFRSRDFWPQAAVGILSGKKLKYLGPPISKTTIPEVPPNRLMHIDSYGNLKTTVRSSKVKFKPGEKLRITINHLTHTAYYANGNFAVKAGDLAFAPGSSGGPDPFIEVFLRSGNAYLHFGKPPVESEIDFERFS